MRSRLESARVRGSVTVGPRWWSLVRNDRQLSGQASQRSEGGVVCQPMQVVAGPGLGDGTGGAVARRLSDLDHSPSRLAAGRRRDQAVLATNGALRPGRVASGSGGANAGAGLGEARSRAWRPLAWSGATRTMPRTGGPAPPATSTATIARPSARLLATGFGPAGTTVRVTAESVPPVTSRPALRLPEPVAARALGRAVQTAGATARPITARPGPAWQDAWREATRRERLELAR
jgi:hypothetical protein